MSDDDDDEDEDMSDFDFDDDSDEDGSQDGKKCCSCTEFCANGCEMFT